MSLPIRVKCTDENGHVVYVNLSADWCWRAMSFEGRQVTAIFSRSVATIETPLGAEAPRQVVVPCRVLVLQTPSEMIALEREAYKDALRAEIEVREELAAERAATE